MAKSKKVAPGPTVHIEHTTINGSKPELVALAEAAKANAEAIKLIAEHISTAPLISVGPA